jgi:nucleoside-diphosphate-sugar epimerase
MRIWITGGAGFLGQATCSPPRITRTQCYRLSRRKNDGRTQSYQIDLASEEAVAQLHSVVDDTGEPDVVIHSAARQPGLKGNFVITSDQMY